MKTAELIDLLGTNLEPVDSRQLSRSLVASLSIGLAAALVAIIVVLGIRTDLDQPKAVAFLLLKLLFTLAVLVPAFVYLLKLIRPGGERTRHLAVVTLPFLAIFLLAAISLSATPRAHWYMMLIGEEWRKCLVSILVLAVMPFAAIVWAARKAAPTDLTRAGSIAGLVAGGVSATAYAAHGTGDSLPYIALWYGGSIALCALAGALLGPRVLRW